MPAIRGWKTEGKRDGEPVSDEVTSRVGSKPMLPSTMSPEDVEKINRADVREAVKKLQERKAREGPVAAVDADDANEVRSSLPDQTARPFTDEEIEAARSQIAAGRRQVERSIPAKLEPEPPSDDAQFEQALLLLTQSIEAVKTNLRRRHRREKQLRHALLEVVESLEAWQLQYDPDKTDDVTESARERARDLLKEG